MERRTDKRCPFCGEGLREEAVFCRYCNRDLEDEEFLRSRVRVRQMAMLLLAIFGIGVLLALIGSLR